MKRARSLTAAQGGALVTGDLHLSPNPRDAYRSRWFRQRLPELVRQHRAQSLVVLGDLTEYKDEHPAALVNDLVDGFAALSKLCEVFILKGNHDYLNADAPFFRFLGHLPNITWINSPERLELPGVGPCLFLPHERRPQEAWRDLDLRGTIFCHQTFTGAKSESGREMEGVAVDIFPRSARVISGDVHVAQKVGPVLYAGAPYTIDHGDDFDPHILLVGPEQHEVATINSGASRKVLMKVLGKEFVESLREAKGADNAPHAQPGDVIKIRIELLPGDSTTAAEARRAARAWADDAGVELAAVQIIAPKGGASPNARREAPSDDPALIRAYAKKMEQGQPVVAAGLKIIEKVG